MPPIDKRGGQQSRRKAKSLKFRGAAQRGKKGNARKTGRCLKIRPHHQQPSFARDAAGPVHQAEASTVTSGRATHLPFPDLRKRRTSHHHTYVGIKLWHEKEQFKSECR